MGDFVSIVYLVGKVGTAGVELLGTAFLVRSDGLFVTSRHVVGDNATGLVLIPPKVQDINDYQDVSDRSCQVVNALVIDVNPFADLVTLKVEGLVTMAPELGSLDEIDVGESVEVYGFPHCVDSRMVVTYQSAILGAKVLLESGSLKIKHAVVNFQTRPGQSGSVIYSNRLGKVVGLLSGTYVPQGSYVSVNGINPAELNQTSHVVSAQYIKEMI